MKKEIQAFLERSTEANISQERKNQLQVLENFIQDKVRKAEPVQLNFICTHNSRRSQLAQVWAKVAADYFKIEVATYSGGVEITACNDRTIATLKRAGFVIQSEGTINPHYAVKWGSDEQELILFSKLFDDSSNPSEKFAAVMTCSHADANCPFVPGCEKRISLPYEDPGAFDATDQESEMYDQRSKEIAAEMFYVFSKIQTS
jgi:arsenate reductase